MLANGMRVRVDSLWRGLSTTKEGASLSARCSKELNVCLLLLTDLRLSFSPGTKIRGELGEFDLQDPAELGRLTSVMPRPRRETRT